MMHYHFFFFFFFFLLFSVVWRCCFWCCNKRFYTLNSRHFFEKRPPVPNFKIRTLVCAVCSIIAPVAFTTIGAAIRYLGCCMHRVDMGKSDNSLKREVILSAAYYSRVMISVTFIYFIQLIGQAF